MPRQAAAGRSVFGHFERQTFSDGALSVALEIVFDSRRPFRYGAVIQSGLMRLKDKEGWETVTPIAGLIGCKPKA